MCIMLLTFYMQLKSFTFGNKCGFLFFFFFLNEFKTPKIHPQDFRARAHHTFFFRIFWLFLCFFFHWAIHPNGNSLKQIGKSICLCSAHTKPYINFNSMLCYFSCCFFFSLLFHPNHLTQWWRWRRVPFSFSFHSICTTNKKNEWLQSIENRFLVPWPSQTEQNKTFQQNTKNYFRSTYHKIALFCIFFFNNLNGPTVHYIFGYVMRGGETGHVFPWFFQNSANSTKVWLFIIFHFYWCFVNGFKSFQSFFEKLLRF